MPRLNAGNDIENWPRLEYEEIERRLENRDYLTWIDYRNAAFMAALALFGRRVSEILELKVKDVRYDEQYIYASFTTLKQFSPARVVCAQCGTSCRASWRFCKKCGASLEGLPVIEKKIFIKDNRIRELVELTFRDNVLFCDHDKSDNCVHIGFAWAIPKVYKFLSAHGQRKKAVSKA